jgi:hypothetical protein
VPHAQPRVNHPDVPDTVQADARDHLQYLEAASPGSGELSGEARMNMAATGDLQSVRQVVEVPRPRCGTT